MKNNAKCPLSRTVFYFNLLSLQNNCFVELWSTMLIFSIASAPIALQIILVLQTILALHIKYACIWFLWTQTCIFVTPKQPIASKEWIRPFIPTPWGNEYGAGQLRRPSNGQIGSLLSWSLYYRNCKQKRISTQVHEPESFRLRRVYKANEMDLVDRVRRQL